MRMAWPWNPMRLARLPRNLPPRAQRAAAASLLLVHALVGFTCFARLRRGLLSCIPCCALFSICMLYATLRN